MAKKIENMTDDELSAEADRLATQRTEVRLQQNAVAQQQQIRQALATLPPETRRIVKLTVEGNVAPDGESKGAQA